MHILFLSLLNVFLALKLSWMLDVGCWMFRVKLSILSARLNMKVITSSDGGEKLNASMTLSCCLSLSTRRRSRRAKGKIGPPQLRDCCFEGENCREMTGLYRCDLFGSKNNDEASINWMKIERRYLLDWRYAIVTSCLELGLAFCFCMYRHYSRPVTVERIFWSPANACSGSIGNLSLGREETQILVVWERVCAFWPWRNSCCWRLRGLVVLGVWILKSIIGGFLTDFRDEF